MVKNSRQRPSGQVTSGSRSIPRVALEVVADAQGYQLSIPPGAKAVWTVQECAGTVELLHGQSFPLSPRTTVLLLARDDDAILKVATDDHEQQGRLRTGESATLTGPATMSLRECACGTTHCIERHRLAGWNPLQPALKTQVSTTRAKIEGFVTLWDCLASAVKGPQAQLKTGAFVQGMYFPLLAQEGLYL